MGGGSPHLPSHGATGLWVPSAPPGTPLECWHPEFRGKTQNFGTGSQELWLIPGGSGCSPCSEHPWMSGVRVPDSACSLSGALGWISGMDFPPGTSLAGSAQGEPWRDSADEPLPLPCSSFLGAGECNSMDSQEPLLLRMESFSHVGNGAGSSQPGIPQGLQSSWGALECGAGFAIPDLRVFSSCSSCACIHHHPQSPGEWDPQQPGMQHSMSNLLWNPGSGSWLLLPWKWTLISSHPM